MSRVDLTIPDIGNFSDVAVVDVLVKTGDVVAVDTPLVTLETDKASMDVPATAAGTVTEVLLKRGDKVSKGSLIARVEAAAPGAAASPSAAPPPATVSAPAAPAESAGDTVRMPAANTGAAERGAAEFNRATQLVVLGAGPAGVAGSATVRRISLWEGTSSATRSSDLARPGGGTVQPSRNASLRL